MVCTHLNIVPHPEERMDFEVNVKRAHEVPFLDRGTGAQTLSFCVTSEKSYPSLCLMSSGQQPWAESSLQMIFLLLSWRAFLKLGKLHIKIRIPGFS